MTNPQQPDSTAPGGPPPSQPYPSPAYQQPSQAFGQPTTPQQTHAPKRGTIFTSKPAIGIGALVIGLILGAGLGGGSAASTTAAPAPTVTVTATETATPEATVDDETADDADQPTDDATEQATPQDTSYRYGKSVGFTYEDVEISLKVSTPKPSTNMFDKNNLEAKLTVCNKGSDTIEEMSAEGLGLYAEDSQGGQYDLYGPYRSPEFPVYSYDSSVLRPGKCHTGWVSFEDGRKAVRIATEVGDSTYSWSKTGN